LVQPGDLPAALRVVRERGGVVQTTFVLPDEPWQLSSLPLACVAEVATEADATAALVAAIRGADLAVSVADDVPGRERFIDDLHRLCQVSWFDSTVAEPSALSADQQQVLALLAAGASLPDIADQLFLSLRTTERRLSAAKRLLGVRTTAEAVLAWTGRAQ
jgi:DNA-binding NarL/FixJ family response regulator